MPETRTCQKCGQQVDNAERVEVLTANGPVWRHKDCQLAVETGR